MDFDKTMSRVKQVVDVAIKAYAHAFVLIFTGAALCLWGNKETGQPIIAAGLAIFRGGNGN
jgi:hypothetical protein